MAGEMAEPESGKQSLNFSFDSLADELEGKEPASSAKDLTDKLFNVVYGGQTGVVQKEVQTDFSLFGRRLAQDVRVELGDGAGKIHHSNGDLTVFNALNSYTQTTDQGGFYRVGADVEKQVIFHLRGDGDIDIIGPGFDDTLHLTRGEEISIWKNESGTLSITLNLITGETAVVFNPSNASSDAMSGATPSAKPPNPVNFGDL